MTLDGFCMNSRRVRHQRVYTPLGEVSVQDRSHQKARAGFALLLSSGDLLLGMLPSELSPLPHWAVPVSSQRDSGLPTELAAARHPGPCPGNTTWFLHCLLPAPGYHSENQRYGAHCSPGASAGRGLRRASGPAPHPT